MEVNQQAKAAGMHGREATTTFEVDTCGGNLCAHTTTHRGIITSGDVRGSVHHDGRVGYRDLT